MDDKKNIRILLVDDEPPLLGLMKTYLSKLGYEVQACPDGKSATAAFESAGGKFDLIVADVTLPDVSGQDMSIELAKNNPDVRVLLCSGYPVQLHTLPDDVRPRFAALDKPFLPNMLATTVEKLMKKK
jgi:DNA-binding NtrC family response regulator